MNHRSIIKTLIVFVIFVVVAWSVVNISEYAHQFHASWVVWSLGLALGTANALSVYALIIARTAEVRKPALVGILLFGGMSGALQTLLYLSAGAPWLAALAFGWFGPAAEGILSWLHAALSEEPLVVRRGQRAKSDVMQVHNVHNAASMQAHNLHNAAAPEPMQPGEVMQPASSPHNADRARALELHRAGYSRTEVAQMIGRNYQTVASWIRRGVQDGDAAA